MSRFEAAGTTEHGFFEERLSAYLDGELTPRERETVDRHLETCSTCQWELETLEQTIQWARELPTLPVPRMFTIPVPAQPVRSSTRRWNFLPVLQGATALIAVLLVFAVAGDLMFGSLRMGSAPDTVVQEVAAPSSTEVALEVTVEVEAPAGVEAPAAEEAAPAEPALEVMTVVETVVVEKEVAVAPTEAPLAAESVSSTMPAVSGEAVAPEATPQPPADQATYERAPEVLAEEAAMPEAEAATVEAEAPPRLAEEGAVAGGGEPPMMLSAPSDLITVTEPSTQTVGTELALAPVTEQAEAELRTPGEPGINWLRVIEFSLGGVLVLLAAATIVFTIERRRAR